MRPIGRAHDHSEQRDLYPVDSRDVLTALLRRCRRPLVGSINSQACTSPEPVTMELDVAATGSEYVNVTEDHQDGLIQDHHSDVPQAISIQGRSRRPWRPLLGSRSCLEPESARKH